MRLRRLLADACGTSACSASLRTQAGPSHRVRLWRGGPASTILAARRSIVWRLWYSYPSSRLLALPEVRKRPWPLRRSRGDGNGGRFVRSPCLLSRRGLPYIRHFPLVPVQRWSIELPATTVGERRRRRSLRRHKGGLWTVFLTSCHKCCCSVAFKCQAYEGQTVSGQSHIWRSRCGKSAIWRFQAACHVLTRPCQ